MSIHLIGMLWLSGKLTQGFIIENGIKERCFLSFRYDDEDQERRARLQLRRSQWSTNVCEWL